MQTSTYGSHDEQGTVVTLRLFPPEASEMFGSFRECSRSLGGKWITLCETSSVSAESSFSAFGFFRKTSKEKGRGDRLLHIGCFRQLRLLPAFLRKSRDFSQSSTCTCDVLILIYALYDTIHFGVIN